MEDNITSSLPAWLPLLLKPYENLLGSRSIWDLRMADGTAVRIERGGQGLNNAVYRVRVREEVYGCKLFVVDERLRVYREWAALRALQEAGLRLAPEPVALALNEPLPQPVIVYRWVEGTSLAGQRLTPNDLHALIGNLADIHRVQPAPDTQVLTAWTQPANYAGYLNGIDTTMAKLRAWAADQQTKRSDLPTWASDVPSLLPLVEQATALAKAIVAGDDLDAPHPLNAFIRLDGNLDNVLRDPSGNFCFIDWEFSGRGDPAYDLAELRWHPKSLHIAQPQWDEALARYPIAQDDPGFVARLRAYMQLLPAWWVSRSVLYLLEGAGQIGTHKRLAPVPRRLYMSVRKQLGNYLAALGLIEPPEQPEETEDD